MQNPNDDAGSDDELVPPSSQPSGCWYCESAEHEDVPCPQRKADVDAFIDRFGLRRTGETETSV
jgi:hypothetical protein